MKEAGIDDVPVIVGGIIPERDAGPCKELGVAAVFTPKDFSLTQAMARHRPGDPGRPRTGLDTGPVNPDLPRRSRTDGRASS